MMIVLVSVHKMYPKRRCFFAWQKDVQQKKIYFNNVTSQLYCFPIKKRKLWDWLLMMIKLAASTLGLKIAITNNKWIINIKTIIVRNSNRYWQHFPNYAVTWERKRKGGGRGEPWQNPALPPTFQMESTCFPTSCATTKSRMKASQREPGDDIFNAPTTAWKHLAIVLGEGGCSWGGGRQINVGLRFPFLQCATFLLC